MNALLPPGYNAGYRPGYHAPGTLIPLGAIYAQQQQVAVYAYQQAAAESARQQEEEETFFLLLF